MQRKSFKRILFSSKEDDGCRYDRATVIEIIDGVISSEGPARHYLYFCRISARRDSDQIQVGRTSPQC